MKSTTSQILARLTELTQGLDFPSSESTDPILPFIWDRSEKGEFNLEKLFKTQILDFYYFAKGGPIIQTGNLEAYFKFCLQEAEKHNSETHRKYQTLLDTLRNNLINLELLDIREMYQGGNFHILLGMTRSGDFLGISPNITSPDYRVSVGYYANSDMGIYEKEQIFLESFQPQTDITASLLSRLESALQDLVFFEPDTGDYYPGKGWTVRAGATREFTIHSLLEAIGYVRNYPPCQFYTPQMREADEEYGYDEDNERYRALDEFLATNLTNLCTYIVYVEVNYFYFVIGQTSSGDWAGVISMSVST
jgi:hypothetical protein